MSGGARTDCPNPPRRNIRKSTRAKESAHNPEPNARHRNLRSLMKNRLPARIFSLLQETGALAERHRVSVYAVGGCVRDLLLARPNGDVDVTVEGKGIHFAKALARQHKARVNIHERFGTATVTFADQWKLDIATTRMEHYASPAALPTVKPGSIRQDISRRDFTINTLAVRLNTPCFGDLVDDYGGQQDLRDKTIRVLHDRSFIDDPTRAFRAIRFEQRLGFRLSKDTALLIRDAVKRNVFQRLSPSRLSDAILQVLSEREPGKVLARLDDFHLLPFIHPQLKWSAGLARLLKSAGQAIAWHTRLKPDRPVPHWVVFGMALLDTLPLPAAEATLARFTFPRHQARSMRWVRQESDGLLRTLNTRQRVTPPETYRLLRHLTDETIVFLMAKTRSETGKRKLAALLTTAQHATPILTGKDLKAMGLTPGPLYKTVLDRLEDARLHGTVKTDADERRLVNQLTKRS